MGPEEWRQIFYSLGKAPFWVTISGGEPFLREDLPDLVGSLYDICRPAIINIPTNGLLTKRIPGYVNRIACHCVDAQIVINLSIDELDQRHDTIRRIAGNFDKSLETLRALKRLEAPNVTVGIHTVISKFNVDRIPDVYRSLLNLGPDSYVAEIAEAREELGTTESDIAPSYPAYTKAVDFLTTAQKRTHLDGIGRITRALRAEYYQITKRILKEQTQIIPCYAGFASTHIAPNGDVWACCTRAESMGNVRQNGYNFNRVWFSQEADALRKRIKADQCHCPLANASYTNMLFDPKTIFRIIRNYAMNDQTHRTQRTQ